MAKSEKSNYSRLEEFRSSVQEAPAIVEEITSKIKPKRKKQIHIKTLTPVRHLPTAHSAPRGPNDNLQAGMSLPKHIADDFATEKYNTPIEDLDEFYQNQNTFVVVNKRNEIFRFSANDALWLFSPFHFLRRLAIHVLVQPIFKWIVNLTIVITCLLLTQPTRIIFLTVEDIAMLIFTFEFIVKILAMGFVLDTFTYLRQPWHSLEFFNVFVWLMSVFLGNIIHGSFVIFRLLQVTTLLRNFSVFKHYLSLKELLRDLKNVIKLILIAVSCFALIGQHLYCGSLLRKCVRIPDPSSKMSGREFRNYRYNQSNWGGICGKFSGSCPDRYTCIETDSNPDNGYTSFDTFGWAFLSAFRLFTLDFWEDLYQMIIKTEGPWHTLFFIGVLLFGSFYLGSLLLAVMIMSQEHFWKKLALEDSKKYPAIQSERALGKNNLQIPYIDDDNVDDNAVSPSMQQQRLSNPTEASTSLDETFRPDEEPKCNWLKRLSAPCMSCLNFCCVWNCCDCWTSFQKYISLVVFDAFFELFIFITIMTNMLLMALDHPGLSYQFVEVLAYANFFFTLVYIIEAILKILAISPKNYFSQRWTNFEFFIVVLCILEIMLEGIKGLSFHIFQVFRVFRLAKYWPTFNLFLRIVGSSFNPLFAFLFMFSAAMFVVIVFGMQLFGLSYIYMRRMFDDEVIPRFNFVDFLSSFMIVFRALCGEWIESMWDCQRVSKILTMPYFFSVVIIGKLMLLNLFVALLIVNSFHPSGILFDKETNKLAEAFDRIKRFTGLRRSPQTNLEESGNHVGEGFSDYGQKENPKQYFELDVGYSGMSSKELQKIPDGTTNALENVTAASASVEEPSAVAEDNDIEKGCPDCCYQFIPFCAGKDTPFWKTWRDIRIKFNAISTNKFYKIGIIICIVLNILLLAFGDKNIGQKKTLQDVIKAFDYAFTTVIFIEMCIAMVAIGCKKYFSNGWYWLDFIIVFASIINFGGYASTKPLYKITRALRGLRPLMLLSRIQPIRELVNLLVQSVVSVINVLVIGFVIWLTFAIVGVQLFGGKYYRCVDQEGEYFNLHHKYYQDFFNNSYAMPGYYECKHIYNNTWVNSLIHFDNVADGFLALLEVATFKGWISIMANAVDSMDIHVQPIYEINKLMYLYFVAFAIFGYFYTLVLFVGSYTNNYYERKMRADDGTAEMLMSEDETIHLRTMQLMASKAATIPIPKPQSRLHEIVFNFVNGQIFDMLVKTLITVNLIVLALYRYAMLIGNSEILNTINAALVAAFVVEICLEILAHRSHYFKNGWNVFDLIIVALSTTGIVVFFAGHSKFESAKIIQIARLPRLFRGAKELRTLLTALLKPYKDIVKFIFLFFIIIYSYSLIAMSLFRHVKPKLALDATFNFGTFGYSLILLFQTATTAGWDGILESLTPEQNCIPDTEFVEGNCGNTTNATAFLVSYLGICFFIVITMFITMLVETSRELKIVQESLSEDDFDMFYKTWQKFDPDGSNYIKLEQLNDFLEELDEPLRIHVVNKYKIAVMDFAICIGDEVYHGDVLEAVVKEYFARRGRLFEGREDQTKPVGYEKISTTLIRQREEKSAMIIQKMWRRYQ